jgi:hypothetical protein
MGQKEKESRKNFGGIVHLSAVSTFLNTSIFFYLRSDKYHCTSKRISSLQAQNTPWRKSRHL